MVDTGGVAYNAIRLIGICAGGYTAVIGPGPMGIVLQQMAQSMGSKTIVIGYKDEARLAVAKKVGADYIIESSEIDDVVGKVRKITDGRGVDRAFDCAGSNDTLGNAILMTGKGGKVGIVAYPKQGTTQKVLYYMVKNQITVQGVRANPNCSQPLLDLIADGVVDTASLVTHVFSIDEIEEAFDTFVNQKEGAVKVVIHPNGEEKQAGIWRG